MQLLSDRDINETNDDVGQIKPNKQQQTLGWDLDYSAKWHCNALIHVLENLSISPNQTNSGSNFG